MHRILLFLMTLLISSPFTLLQGHQPTKKSILVVGGAGYIGSHVNKMLQQAGYQTIVLDNLCHGTIEAIPNTTFIEGDIADGPLLDNIFKSYHIDAVMHFAALKDVGESVREPLKYYSNNVAATVNLLDAMRRHKINVFIFSSSASIFGNTQSDYVKENDPCNPINPYGQSKLMVESILTDSDRAYGLRFCSLRYFNVAGGDPEGIIKNFQKKEANLIPVVLRSIQNGTTVSIFGTDFPTRDGTGIRDYIHLEDLGSAHILAMEKIFAGAPSDFYNLGNGRGFSVREVIAAAEKVTGKKVKFIETPRRQGDPAILLASSEKAKRELNWQPKYFSLETMIEHAWRAMQ